MYKLLIFSALISFINACTTAPDFSVVPNISYISISRNAVIQTQVNLKMDSLQIKIKFEDGDGDLYDGDKHHLFVIDKRQDTLFTSFSIPQYPNLGRNKGISGEITFQLYDFCCIPPPTVAPTCSPDPKFPKDEVIYQIYIIDKAGHKSNIIETPPITIQCTK